MISPHQNKNPRRNQLQTRLCSKPFQNRLWNPPALLEGILRTLWSNWTARRTTRKAMLPTCERLRLTFHQKQTNNRANFCIFISTLSITSQWTNQSKCLLLKEQVVTLLRSPAPHFEDEHRKRCSELPKPTRAVCQVPQLFLRGSFAAARTRRCCQSAAGRLWEGWCHATGVQRSRPR